jgi:hypothetical protein
LPRRQSFSDDGKVQSLAGLCVGAREVEMQFIESLRHLSANELGVLGMEDVAYVKHVVVDGTDAFSVHAANGTQIAVMADREVAFAVVRQHDMEPVSVH